jgi:hypothetical protein
VSDEAEWLRRADAALEIRIRTSLGDESRAAARALHELTRERDWEVREAQRRARQEWDENGPKQPQVWFGRWQRWFAWDMARTEVVRKAGAAASQQYRATYLQAHGQDFDELVRAATEKSERLAQERAAEISAAEREIIAVVRALNRQLRWAPERIGRRLGLDSATVRSTLGLPQLPRHSHRPSGGGGGVFRGVDFSDTGDGDSGGDGGGGGD